MTIKPLFDENELLSNLAEGKPAAFKVVYESFNKRIYNVSLKILKSTVLAEEVTQEVFLKLWKHEHQFNDFDHLEAWLRSTARNLALNAFRRVILEKKISTQAGQQFVDHHNDTEEAILLSDARKLLNTAIGKLPAQQREVYILCQQEGLKYEEVAERLNITVNTVKTHMKRALASVRGHMKSSTDVAALLILFKLF